MKDIFICGNRKVHQNEFYCDFLTRGLGQEMEIRVQNAVIHKVYEQIGDILTKKNYFLSVTKYMNKLGAFYKKFTF